MLQVVQSLKSGVARLETVPVPEIESGHVLIKNFNSLISIGTERMLTEFGRASLLTKAKKQPEKVRQVISKAKSDGLRPTLNAVMRKLDTPIPLGYSSAGEVIAVGADVEEFKVGDRVVTNGSHSEFVLSPVNLVAKIPENVSYESASFTVVSSIGLQGIRLADPKFGETVVVFGLGLIGLISVQLLISSGCRVIGIDLDKEKLNLAKSYGADVIDASILDPVPLVMDLTDQVGADSVIITASTDSNTVIRQSAEIARKRGKIVLVGAVGLDIDRSTFYHKELTFQVSCSYGPGRYDSRYEDEGIDYPLPYVRWTEKRNFDAILHALSSGQLDTSRLISRSVAFEDCASIYDSLGLDSSIAIVLNYSSSKTDALKRSVCVDESYLSSQGAIAIIGAGNFTQATLLPSLSKSKANIKYLVSKEGLSSTLLARKFKIPISSTDYEGVLRDGDVSALIISTRHNLHAPMVIEGLKANKHILVEKPLCLNLEELDKISSALSSSKGSITVGFNRRFSPHVLKIRELLGENTSGVSLICTMNAGFIPKDHWVHDPKIGGGRIMGEACHYIDLASYILNSSVSEVCMQSLGDRTDISTDNAMILLKFKNGSQAVINYIPTGSSSYSKERVEVHSSGKTLVLDNFRVLYGYGYKRAFTKSGNVLLKTAQDKGHDRQFSEFSKFIKNGGNTLIPFQQIENVARASILTLESLMTKSWVRV